MFSHVRLGARSSRAALSLFPRSRCSAHPENDAFRPMCQHVCLVAGSTCKPWQIRFFPPQGPRTLDVTLGHRCQPYILGGGGLWHGSRAATNRLSPCFAPVVPASKRRAVCCPVTRQRHGEPRERKVSPMCSHVRLSLFLPPMVRPASSLDARRAPRTMRFAPFACFWCAVVGSTCLPWQVRFLPSQGPRTQNFCRGHRCQPYILGGGVLWHGCWAATRGAPVVPASKRRPPVCCPDTRQSHGEPRERNCSHRMTVYCYCCIPLCFPRARRLGLDPDWMPSHGKSLFRGFALSAISSRSRSLSTWRHVSCRCSPCADVCPRLPASALWCGLLLVVRSPIAGRLVGARASPCSCGRYHPRLAHEIRLARGPVTAVLLHSCTWSDARPLLSSLLGRYARKCLSFSRDVIWIRKCFGVPPWQYGGALLPSGVCKCHDPSACTAKAPCVFASCWPRVSFASELLPG